MSTKCQITNEHQNVKVSKYWKKVIRKIVNIIFAASISDDFVLHHEGVVKRTQKMHCTKVSQTDGGQKKTSKV